MPVEWLNLAPVHYFYWLSDHSANALDGRVFRTPL
jgi:hypothetical protein